MIIDIADILPIGDLRRAHTALLPAKRASGEQTEARDE